MPTAAIDINSAPVRWRQFDPDRPVTLLEALHDGEEQPAIDFVDWLASDGQRERLYHMAIERLGDEDVKSAAKAWAREVESG